MTSPSRLLLSTLLLLPVACTATSSPSPDSQDNPSDGEKDGTPANTPGDGDGDGGGTKGLDVRPIQEGSELCGDGIRDDDEACDDGNVESGDGCSTDCLGIDEGFICREEGTPCRAFAKCGDGKLSFPEQCDDAGLSSADGCSSTCKVEVGSKCKGEPSVCESTLCGDGTIEGAETCDDGNTNPLDGCSPLCQIEPQCTEDGCTSSCGDGLIIGSEQCDDANSLDGDGCSSICQQEEGYLCEQGDVSCEDIGGECALRLPIVYRDFNAAHPDFGQEITAGLHTVNIASDKLNAAGKPEMASSPADAHIQDATSYSQWYIDTEFSSTILDSIVLFPNESGEYVNRLDNEGTRYRIHEYVWCGDAAGTGCNAGTCAQQEDDYIECFDTCTPWGEDNTQVCASYARDSIDGNPLFFPLDEHPDALTDGDRSVAEIPAEVYQGAWAADPSGKERNFFFTSEITYWFKYSAGQSAQLSFVGDDDVWVYINRRLAVDLGGLHVPVQGSFDITGDGTLNTSSGAAGEGLGILRQQNAADFGLEDGGVYEVKVFHAERNKAGSSFRLTLSGFNSTRSDCNPHCGDAIIAAGEECDDGEAENVGGYNKCSADCRLASFCGDGIVDSEEGETCDDADPNAGENCAGCRIIVIR